MGTEGRTIFVYQQRIFSCLTARAIAKKNELCWWCLHSVHWLSKMSLLDLRLYRRPTGGRQGNICQMTCKNGHCICNNIRNKPQGTSGRQVNIGQVNCQNGKCVWNTMNRKTNDEMESWQLRFMNGTTVHGAGVPPEIWVREPAKEKKETKETNIPHKQNKTRTGGRQGNICQMTCKNGHCICNNIRKRPQEEDLVEDHGLLRRLGGRPSDTIGGGDTGKSDAKHLQNSARMEIEEE